MNGPDLPAQLRETEFLDFRSPEIAEFTASAISGHDGTRREQAVALFYAVRDRIRYEVYGADLSRSGLRASQVVRAGAGMCLHKSVLYTACLRSLGIPARLALADVRNHLTSERLQRLMGGNVFRHHCYSVILLDGRWLKVTPVFTRHLCKLHKIAPLEFDGTGDSVLHPFDLRGRRHMEFLEMHGEFDDVPYDRVLRDLWRAHPGLFDDATTFVSGSLERDAPTSGRWAR